MTDPKQEGEWKCLRCLWILTGREGEEIPTHSPACPFRDTGSDPDPEELELGGAHA